MLQAALKEWRDAKAKGAINESQAAFLIQRIDRIMDTMIARESAKVEEGLGSLAIVATASPFIGLFGTVWGIMHAFQSIAISKNTSLAVVAPSIAEALFATAVGLIAAIPAYIAYNKFSTDAGKYAGRLEGFADDLSTAIQRRLAEGLEPMAMSSNDAFATGGGRGRPSRPPRARRPVRDQRHPAGRRDAGAADHLHDQRPAADRRRAAGAAQDRGRRPAEPARADHRVDPRRRPHLRRRDRDPVREPGLRA
jgi:hypothetical protein